MTRKGEGEKGGGKWGSDKGWWVDIDGSEKRWRLAPKREREQKVRDRGGEDGDEKRNFGKACITGKQQLQRVRSGRKAKTQGFEKGIAFIVGKKGVGGGGKNKGGEYKKF